jgi:hypothetical protein
MESVECFDGATGVFTAPRAGTFLFHGNVEFFCLTGGCSLEQLTLYLAKKVSGGSWVTAGTNGVGGGSIYAKAYDDSGSNDNVTPLSFTIIETLGLGDQLKMVGKALTSTGDWSWSVVGGSFFHGYSVD